MTAKGDNAAPPYAMVYASRQGGPRVYVGACIVSPGETDKALLERINALPFGEWFDESAVIVNNRPKA